MAFVQDRIGWMAGLTKGTGFDEWVVGVAFCFVFNQYPPFLVRSRSNDCTFFLSLRIGLLRQLVYRALIFRLPS